MMQIRKALAADSQELTRIACAAKRHWNYPEEYYKVWANELKVTSNYIKENDVWLFTDDDNILGFYSVVDWAGEVYLDHLFVDPRFLQQGIGRQLIQHLIQEQRKTGVTQLKVLVDPNAAGFYDKIGAEFIEYVPSNIVGRTIPLYLLEIGN